MNSLRNGFPRQRYIAVVFLLIVLVHGNVRAENIDEETFRLINDFRNPVLDYSLYPLKVSQLLPPATVALLFYQGFKGENHPEKIRSGKLAIAGLFSTFVLGQGLKLAVQRDRPVYHMTDVHGSHRNSAFVKNYLGSEQYSFPSQTSTAAFFSAKYFSDEFGYYPLWYLWAALCSWSRIYNGAHYPSDVVVGGLLGYGLGWGTILLREKTSWCKKKQVSINAGLNSVFLALSF